jgi:hypothetical protein
VDKESVKGTYTGDCKKGKAHGKGKSVGTDTYEGEFKNGLPDGEGTYTWENKNVFEGKYVKGLREGKGTMTIKRQGANDSLLVGFWKKDVYVGKNEKPWQVYSQSGSVRSVNVEFAPDEVRKVKVIITNTTGGVGSLGGQRTLYKIDNTFIIKGNFIRETAIENNFKSTERNYFEVTFPFRVKLQIAREEVEFELFETGSYTINISINQ